MGDRAYRKWVVPRMRSGRFVAWLAVTSAGRPVAGGALWTREEQPRPGVPAGRVPYLMSMYTDPEFRGRGLATRIVKAAVDWSRRNGFTWMLLHASRMGRPIYRRMGWKPRPEMWVAVRPASRGRGGDPRPWRLGLAKSRPSAGR